VGHGQTNLLPLNQTAAHSLNQTAAHSLNQTAAHSLNQTAAHSLNPQLHGNLRTCKVSRIALQGESAMAKQAHAVQLDALPLPALQVEVPLQRTAFLGVGLRWDSQPDLISQTTAVIVALGRPL
jgi:hypothetical protein